MLAVGMGMQNGMQQQQPQQQQRAPSMLPNPSNGFLNPNPMVGSRPGSANGMYSQNRMTMMSNNDALSMRGAVDPNRYAPSIAPSERSNIGQASRYRPVQSQPEGPGQSALSTSTIRVTEKAKSPPANDDDDEGWGLMKKKNKKKAKAQEDDSGLGALGYL
jgi:hypothetical protein